MLKGFTGDVKGQILGIDDTLDEAEVFGNEILAVIHDEDSSDVELDVVPLLLALEKVERSTNPRIKEYQPYILANSPEIKFLDSPLRNEKQSLEFQLTLD